MLSFAADVVGVLLGAFLGYLLGLRQQRKIDNERDDRRRNELKEALKSELIYLEKEVSRQHDQPSQFFKPLNFNILFLDMPIFTSIVNSGQLLLLDSQLVRLLRELNREVHDHDLAQYVFAGVSGAQSTAQIASYSEEMKRMSIEPGYETSNRVAALLKIVITKRDIISKKAVELIQELTK